MVLGQLVRGISYRDKKTFVRLYQVFVLLHLSYSVSAWAPYTVADKEILEKVQRRDMMMVTNLKGSYEERLATLGMRTLEARRIRGDLIETYKKQARIEQESQSLNENLGQKSGTKSGENFWDKRTDKQTDRQTDKQTDRKTDRQDQI